MTDRKELERGWKCIQELEGAQMADYVGHAYIMKVSDAIDELEKTLNSYAGSQKGIPQLAGDIAEDWIANTFNIRATAVESAHKAFVEKSHGHASVDVSTNFGKEYSLKYYRNADESVKAQAKNVIQNYHEYLSQAKANGTQSPMTFEEYLSRYGYSHDLEELLMSVYGGQGRIIPSDQLDEGITKLRHLIATESARGGAARLANMRNYEETLRELSDRIKDGEGVESIPLSKKEAHAIAVLCKSGNFKPEDFGISINDEVTRDYILNQALKGGITASVVTFALQLVPEMLDLFAALIKEKRIKPNQLRDFGLHTLSTGVKSFLTGGLSCGLYTACRAGKLGANLKNVQPGVIGTIVAITFDVVIQTVDYERGKTDVLEYKYHITRDIIVSASSLAGGAIATAILPLANSVAFVIGSMLGSVTASVAMSVSERILVSLCVSTGFTLFGLVKQDYSLPDEILQDMGITILELEKNNPNKAKFSFSKPNTVSLSFVKPNYIDIQILKRGIIAFHTVGYVF